MTTTASDARTVGTVYFVRCADRIKIGHSFNAPKRIRSLSTSAPDALDILAVVPGSRNFEQAIHKQLAEWRVRLEWFEYRAPVRELMNRIVAEGYDAIGFVEPERVVPDAVSGDLLRVAVQEQIARVETEDHWSTFVSRIQALTGSIERLSFTRRLEMLSGAQFGSLIGLIADGAFTKASLQQGLDLIEKALRHLGQLDDQASQIREKSNEFVLAQAEGIVVVAERSIQELFKFRDIWAGKENPCTEQI